MNSANIGFPVRQSNYHILCLDIEDNYVITTCKVDGMIVKFKDNLGNVRYGNAVYPKSEIIKFNKQIEILKQTGTKPIKDCELCSDRFACWTD